MIWKLESPLWNYNIKLLMSISHICFIFKNIIRLHCNIDFALRYIARVDRKFGRQRTKRRVFYVIYSNTEVIVHRIQFSKTIKILSNLKNYKYQIE